jgi:hypothetical protein
MLPHVDGMEVCRHKLEQLRSGADADGQVGRSQQGGRARDGG